MFQLLFAPVPLGHGRGKVCLKLLDSLIDFFNRAGTPRAEASDLSVPEAGLYPLPSGGSSSAGRFSGSGRAACTVYARRLTNRRK